MTMLNEALIQGLENSGTPDPMVEGLRKLVQEIESVMALFRREVGHVSGDADYTKEGKKKRIADAAVEAADKLRGIENSALGYSDHISQLRDGMQPDQRPSDTTLSFLQEQEIRSRLADLDELQLQIKYQSACAEGGSGSDLIAAAVENDPLPKLSESVIQEGIMLRGQRKSPEQAKLLGHLINLRAAFKDALQEAMGELRKNGLPKDDWLAKVAKGELEFSPD